MARALTVPPTLFLRSIVRQEERLTERKTEMEGEKEREQKKRGNLIPRAFSLLL